MPESNPGQSAPEPRRAFARINLRQFLTGFRDSGTQLHLDPGPP